MPRTKTKPSKVSTNNEDSESNESSVKSANLEAQPNAIKSQLDLSKYMYEKKGKKPHIKVEFDHTTNDSSPEKKNVSGLWEPDNWKDFLLNLRTMRANNDAPVDSMGCHMSADHKAAPKVYRFHCLISLMLSSQTKDEVTFGAMERLRTRGLTVENILSMSDDELGKLIYPVGYWKTKVKYIKKTTQTLKDQYDGDIPDSVGKLCELMGVGPKMAHICMQTAWNKITGIGVDTHVHRISNRIGWVKKPTSTPEDTRKALESWLPSDLWGEVNHLLVGFGQTICKPIKPMCHECLNRDICPTGQSPQKSPAKTNKASLVIKDKSPKTKKVTPTKLKIEPPSDMDDIIERTSDSNVKIKKKVTPSKVKIEENEDMHTLIQKTSDSNVKSKGVKVKIEPKKEEIEQNNTNFLIERTSDTTIKTKSIKKKVTPKKDRSDQDDELNDFEEKTLTVRAETIKKSPRKRKSTTPSKATVEITSDFDVKDNTKVNKTNKQKATKVMSGTEKDSEIKVKRTRQRK